MEMNTVCSQYIYIPNLREFFKSKLELRNLFNVTPQNADVMDINTGTYR